MHNFFVRTFPRTFFSALALHSASLSIEGSQPHAHPLEQLDYTRAFDFKDTFNTYRPLMEHWGCADNVGVRDLAPVPAPVVRRQPRVPPRQIEEDILDPFNPELSHIHARVAYDRLPLLPDQQLEPIVDPMQAMKEAFAVDVLSQLKKERRLTIFKPGIESSIMIALLGGAAAGTMAFTGGAGSMGGSFGILILFFDSIKYMKALITSIYNLGITPPHAMDVLEVSYALNKCFIPNQLWPVIEQKFVMGRTNKMAEADTVKFLQYALGMTSFKPKPLPSVEPQILGQRIRSIQARITNFFEPYEPMSPKDLAKLKSNVEKFCLKLVKLPIATTEARYIFLVGSGGIGKTHFAKELCRWINEAFGGVVRIDTPVISSPEELEGSEVKAGVFLNVLHGFLEDENARGVIVMQDEANFLREKKYNEAVKRTYNGEHSGAIPSRIFGNLAGGQAMTFNSPPKLVLLAANFDIEEDEALKSRFDCIRFPQPKRETLLRYSKEIIRAINREREVSMGLSIPDLFVDDDIGPNYTDLFNKTFAECRSYRRVQEEFGSFLNLLG